MLFGERITIVSLGNTGNAAGVLELPLQTFFRPNAWRGVPRAGPAMTLHCRPKNKKPAEAGFLQGINAC
jgi:hypothetical protein